MDFINLLWLILVYESPPLSIILFFLSSFLLIAGIMYKAWMDAFKLKGIDHRPLNWIEQTHPHLPSPRVILTIVLCCFMLLVVGLQILHGVFPFDDPYQGINLTSLFLLCAAVGTIAELKWKKARGYMLSFLEGTAASFFLRLLLLLTLPGGSMKERGITFFLILLVAASIMMIESTLKRSRKRGLILMLTFSFVFWVFIWLIAM